MTEQEQDAAREQIVAKWSNRQKFAFMEGAQLDTQKRELGHGKFVKWFQTEASKLYSLRTAERYILTFHALRESTFGGPEGPDHAGRGRKRPKYLLLPDGSGRMVVEATRSPKKGKDSGSYQ